LGNKKGTDEIFDLRQQQMTPNSKCASIRLPLNERIHRPFFDWEIVKKHFFSLIFVFSLLHPAPYDSGRVFLPLFKKDV
jgi:hypothetical protein